MKKLLANRPEEETVPVLRLTVPQLLLQKGGDPAAPSGTATLLRLNPSHRSHLRHLFKGWLRVLPAPMV